MEKFKVNGNKDVSTKDIKAKIGLSNKNNHATFFIEGNVFISPEFLSRNYKPTVEEVESNCRLFIRKKLRENNNLSNNFIMNFDISSDRLSPKRKSYLSFQYYFKQNPNNIKGRLDVKKDNKLFFNEIVSNISNELKDSGFALYNSRN